MFAPLVKTPKAKTASQTTPACRGQVGEVPALVHQVVNCPGRPLDTATRAFFEPRFKYDFGAVRIHTDADATESARQINSLAYAVGTNVVFRSDSFIPDTPVGKGLLAHELAHVAQGGPQNQLRTYRDVKKSEKAIRNWGAIDDPKAGRQHPQLRRSLARAFGSVFVGSALNSPRCVRRHDRLISGRLRPE